MESVITFDAIKPLNGRVLVKRLQSLDKIGSLYMPEQHKKNFRCGQVLAVYDYQECRKNPNEHRTPQVRVGDIVTYNTYKGLPIKCNHMDEIMDCILMPEEEIEAIIENGEFQPHEKQYAKQK